MGREAGEAGETGEAALRARLRLEGIVAGSLLVARVVEVLVQARRPLRLVVGLLYLLLYTTPASSQRHNDGPTLSLTDAARYTCPPVHLSTSLALSLTAHPRQGNS